MTNVLDLSLSEARDALKAKKISSKELTQAYVSACERLNPKLNAYITLTPERALKDAEAADAWHRAGMKLLRPRQVMIARDAFEPLGRTHDGQGHDERSQKRGDQDPHRAAV